MQLPKLLELVGLGYSAWFTYRYLLFKVCCPAPATFAPCALLRRQANAEVEGGELVAVRCAAALVLRRLRC